MSKKIQKGNAPPSFTMVIAVVALVIAAAALAVSLQGRNKQMMTTNSSEKTQLTGTVMSTAPDGYFDRIEIFLSHGPRQELQETRVFTKPLKNQNYTFTFDTDSNAQYTIYPFACTKTGSGCTALPTEMTCPKRLTQTKCAVSASANVSIMFAENGPQINLPPVEVDTNNPTPPPPQY